MSQCKNQLLNEFDLGNKSKLLDTTCINVTHEEKDLLCMFKETKSSAPATLWVTKELLDTNK